MYRGTIAYDEPLRAQRCDAGTGKRNDPAYMREVVRKWRATHREHLREYKRKYRAKKAMGSE